MYKLINKIFNRETILYLFFGGCTTVVNTISYMLLYERYGFNNVLSNFVAWFLAVLFAYVTNKLWVFESKTVSGRQMLREAADFFGGRVVTGLLDLMIMYVGVDKLVMPAILVKVVSNVVVIVLNYLISKIYVFKQ